MTDNLPLSTTAWTGVPKPPSDFKWEKKPFQLYTKNYYPVLEVLSSIEKSILARRVDEALFWCVEYANMGKQFYFATWGLLFQITISSMGIENPSALMYLWTQYVVFPF